MSAASIIENLLEHMDRPPEPNCSCHISAPCNDCVEYSAIREAIADAEAYLEEGIEVSTK